VDDLLHEGALAARRGRGLELKVEFEAQPPGGFYAERADEIRQHLRELGVDEEIAVEETPD